LFDGNEVKETDFRVLRCVQVEHATDDEQIDEEDIWVELQNDIVPVMDNVAYTLGDYSPRSRESMKAHALAYALDRTRFLASEAGNDFMYTDRTSSVIQTS
jgi:hypothetical protein